MEWHDRFVRAGVTHVVPVYESVGVGLAATALEGAVMGVLQVPGTSSRVEELRVGAGSAAVGNDLRSMMETVADVNLLGVRTTGGLTRWHEANEPIAAGDVLVAFGDYRALERMAKLVRPAADEEPQ
jgi:Trk K+ transport system NAD-binding subunit